MGVGVEGSRSDGTCVELVLGKFVEYLKEISDGRAGHSALEFSPNIRPLVGDLAEFNEFFICDLLQKN